MNISASGLALLKGHESCRLKAYYDTGKPPIPTIGWGHTEGVKIGDKCTQAQADAWLVADLASAEFDVRTLVDIQLTQNQFDALVSFVYNIGGDQFSTSTMRKKLNAYEPSGVVAKQFDRWIYDDGRIINGLVARRADEKALFLS